MSRCSFSADAFSQQWGGHEQEYILTFYSPSKMMAAVYLMGIVLTQVWHLVTFSFNHFSSYTAVLFFCHLKTLSFV